MGAILGRTKSPTERLIDAKDEALMTARRSGGLLTDIGMGTALARDGARRARYFGFQSRASFCASASCSDDISPATWSRLFVAASRRGASLRREAERLNHMCALTRFCSTPSPRA